MLKVETYLFTPIYLVIFILMMNWIWNEKRWWDYRIHLMRWLRIENYFISVALITMVRLLLSLVPFIFLVFSVGYTDSYFENR
jgi:small-conductance mechanosensitive channel